MISAIQRKWPTKRIFIGKTDLDAAYRRIYANGTTASTCIATVDELAFLCLRSPFGITPTPEEYSTVSEASIDLGNDLLRDESWDTDNLNSPHRSLLPQEEKQQSERHLETADPSVAVISTAKGSVVARWLAGYCFSSCGSKDRCCESRSSVSQDSARSRLLPRYIVASLTVVYSVGVGVVPKGNLKHTKAFSSTTEMHVDMVVVFSCIWR